jgi:hypothetical protein
VENELRGAAMALVHREPTAAEDFSVLGLIVAVIAIIAAAVPCIKTVVDGFFSLIS